MTKYIIVNLITFISVVLGITAIFILILGNFFLSFGFATLAFLTDSIDGFLARKWSVESKFGIMFDTFSDVISYIIYPVIVFYLFFNLRSNIGIFVLIFFIFAALFRLIRFTKKSLRDEVAKKYYVGIPVVFSHFALLVSLLVSTVTSPEVTKIFIIIINPLLSIAMVSSFRFRKPLASVLYLLLMYLIILSILMFYLGL